MPIVVQMHWAESAKERYEAARKQVNWDTEKAEGGIFHVSWWEDDGMHILDVWESREDFERFVGERLMPGIAAIGGIAGEPSIIFHDAHAYVSVAAFATV